MNQHEKRMETLNRRMALALELYGFDREYRVTFHQEGPNPYAFRTKPVIEVFSDGVKIATVGE